MLDEEIFYIFCFGILTERADVRIMRKKEKYYIYGSGFPGARDSPGSREHIRQIQSGRMI